MISDADFLAAQTINAAGTPHDSGVRRYVLTGLLICGSCGRRLHPHWVHGRPGYRCRHRHTSAHPARDRPRWIYWSEHRILTEALDQLTRSGQLAAQSRIEDLIAHLRGTDAVIMCDAATLTIDDPSEDEPAADMDAMAPPQPVGRPIPQPRRPAIAARNLRAIKSADRQPSLPANRDPTSALHAET